MLINTIFLEDSFLIKRQSREAEILDQLSKLGTSSPADVKLFLCETINIRIA